MFAQLEWTGGWDFVVMALTVVLVILGIVTLLKQSVRKELVYWVDSEVQIVGMGENVKGSTEYEERIKIFFEGREVRRVDALILMIKNAGNQPVEKEDFKSNVKVQFGKGAEILSIRGGDGPGSLDTQFMVFRDYFEIEPLLLNQRDELMIVVYVAQYDGTVLVDGRISGVRRIKHVKQRRSNRR